MTRRTCLFSYHWRSLPQLNRFESDLQKCRCESSHVCRGYKVHISSLLNTAFIYASVPIVRLSSQIYTGEKNKFEYATKPPHGVFAVTKLADNLKPAAKATNYIIILSQFVSVVGLDKTAHFRHLGLLCLLPLEDIQANSIFAKIDEAIHLHSEIHRFSPFSCYICPYVRSRFVKGGLVFL